MSKKAWMFPGQGSQEVGMGRELHDASLHTQGLFKRAEDITNRPLRRYMFKGPKEILDRTSNTQVAITIVSLAALAYYVKKHRETPDYVAGHSLGEISGLVAAGAIDEESAVELAFERGLAMEEAGEENPGKMAAIIGLDYAMIDAIVAHYEGAYVANYNITDQQAVISGEAEAVDAVCAEAEAAGARRVVPMSVTIPAHTPRMERARQRVVSVLDRIHFVDPIIPVVVNQTGEVMQRAGEIRETLAHQLTNPVRWSHSLDFLYENGVRRYQEFGRSNVLAGIAKRQFGKGRPAEIEYIEHEAKSQK